MYVYLLLSLNNTGSGNGSVNVWKITVGVMLAGSSVVIITACLIFLVCIFRCVCIK